MDMPPKVFISYSHDSPDHKRWVAELATKLRYAGIDAMLDQWDLSPGDDVTLFMEQGLSESDRVIVICSEEYVRKANAGEGGVGYERMIVTAELVGNLGTDKFIPVIRQDSEKQETPRFLGARFFVNLSDNGTYKDALDILLREIHKVPADKKPPLGKNPFALAPSGQEARPSPAKPTAETAHATMTPDMPDIYDRAVDLARQDDGLGWRQLAKRVTGSAYKSLAAWRDKYETWRPSQAEDVFAVIDDAVEGVAPLLTMGLVGVESGRERLRDQRSILDDIINVSGWDESGLAIKTALPLTLGYLYQGMHGAMAITTGQIDLALALAEMRVRRHGEHSPVWRIPELVGWPRSLETNCSTAWTYLAEAADKWHWAHRAFGSSEEYRMSLSAYYAVLNIRECAFMIKEGLEDSLKERKAGHLFVPLCCVSESRAVKDRAYSLLSRDPKALAKCWTDINVPTSAMKRVWVDWLVRCNAWIGNVYTWPDEMFHASLFEDLVFPENPS